MISHNLKWRSHELQLGNRSCIMGILNVTPDSFSDGGRFFSLDAALAQAERMIEDGADILDIGGESSRPFSEPVSAEEEIRRVMPVIEYLAGKISVPISIDTTKADVAKRAMEAGAAIINDISALRFDPDMASVVAETGALVILMHMLGSPGTMQVDPRYDDVIEDIYGFLEEVMGKAEVAGIAKENMIVDPGIGFGKTIFHNLEIIKNIERFAELDVPVLIGPSRKAFIRKLIVGETQAENTGAGSRELVETGTHAVVSASILNGAHILRVHDVAGARTTATIVDAIKNV